MGRLGTRAALVAGMGLFLLGCEAQNQNAAEAPAEAPAAAEEQAAAAPAAPAAAAYVIQGGTLIDGNGGAPVANSAIVVEGNQITAVGINGEVAVPEGAEIIDATGKFVLPGLIDAKANWNWHYGEPYIAWGVTSAMVSGGRNNAGQALRDVINAGMLEGPRLFMTNVGIAGAGPNNDKEDEYLPGAGDRIVSSVEQAVAHVQAMHEADADFITFANGDGAVDIHAAAVAEAQRLGMAVVFRSMGPQVRAREVCVMGDGIVYVHTGNVGTQIAVDEAAWATYIGLPPDAYSDMDPAKVQPMVEQLLACNAYLEPDMMAAQRGFHRNWARVQQENETFYSDAALMAYYPQWPASGVLENVKDPALYLTPEQLDVRTRGFANMMVFLKAYADAGGKIVAASDTPQSPPGIGMHQEMTSFVEDIGMTPMQAIQAGTSWVADGFLLEDLGRIEAGKLADIIIVNADPTVDILNLRQIDTVMKDGVIQDRSYDPNYGGSLFNNNAFNDDRDLVEGLDWVAALKDATWRPNARNGGWGQTGGIDSRIAPTPAIEKLVPYTIPRGTADTQVTITGFNFVEGSKVLVEGQEVPATITSRTEITATVPASALANVGLIDIVVQNPEPVHSHVWGDTSNTAHVLVPLETTKILSADHW
ncbi:MAG: hypothetical protein RJB62_573 [Pseudomonadota bacterium]|jgi:predicted amidohydrolase